MAEDPREAAERKAQARVEEMGGAEAAKALLGGEVRVLRDRGKILESDFCAQTVVTVHPSSLLRIQEDEERRREYRRFVADLELVRERLAA